MANRDWLDYANLGSNLLRNVQLSDANQNLSGMAATAMSEQSKAALEDRLRDSVFQANMILRKLRSQIQDDASGVFAVATFVLILFHRNNITTASFRTIGDKERLQEVLEGFNSIAEEAGSKLSASDKADALRCEKYMENPAVDAKAPEELICELERAREHLAEIEAALTVPDPKKHLNNWIAIFTVGAGLIGAVFYAESVDLSNPDMSARDSFRTLSWVVPTVMAIIATMVTIVRCVPNKEMRHLRQKAEEAARVRPEILERFEHLQQRVNGEIAKEKVRLENERDDLMARILKSPVQENPFVHQPISIP